MSGIDRRRNDVWRKRKIANKKISHQVFLTTSFKFLFNFLKKNKKDNLKFFVNQPHFTKIVAEIGNTRWQGLTQQLSDKKNNNK